MARKVCSAGTVGPYSYVIIDNEDTTIVASIHDEGRELSSTHNEMEFAERWTTRELQTLIGKRYEVD